MSVIGKGIILTCYCSQLQCYMSISFVMTWCSIVWRLSTDLGHSRAPIYMGLEVGGVKLTQIGLSLSLSVHYAANTYHISHPQHPLGDLTVTFIFPRCTFLRWFLACVSSLQDLTKWKNRRKSFNSDIVKKKEEREQTIGSHGFQNSNWR